MIDEDDVETPFDGSGREKGPFRALHSPADLLAGTPTCALRGCLRTVSCKVPCIRKAIVRFTHPRWRHRARRQESSVGYEFVGTRRCCVTPVSRFAYSLCVRRQTDGASVPDRSEKRLYGRSGSLHCTISSVRTLDSVLHRSRPEGAWISVRTRPNPAHASQVDGCLRRHNRRSAPTASCESPVHWSSTQPQSMTEHMHEHTH